jgi:hypothetical protein
MQPRTFCKGRGQGFYLSPITYRDGLQRAFLLAAIPWIKFTMDRKSVGANFIEKGNEFMAPHIKERKRESERAILLTDHYGHVTLHSYCL